MRIPFILPVIAEANRDSVIDRTTRLRPQPDQRPYLESGHSGPPLYEEHQLSVIRLIREFCEQLSPVGATVEGSTS